MASPETMDLELQVQGSVLLGIAANSIANLTLGRIFSSSYVQGLLRVQQSRRKDCDLLISASAKKHVKVSIVIQRERMTVDLGHEINAHMVFLFGCTFCSFC
jgi:hypothetical protein